MSPFSVMLAINLEPVWHWFGCYNFRCTGKHDPYLLHWSGSDFSYHNRKWNNKGAKKEVPLLRTLYFARPIQNVTMDYLSFEKPIEELENQLTKALELANETGVDMAKTITDIQQKLDNAKKEIYNNLSAWERVQLSRHPQRPYTMAYINALTQGDFIEMHGDRGVKDDKAMVGGWGTIDGKSYMFIGQQKGVNTKMRQYRNFGMANPEGYRKACV